MLQFHGVIPVIFKGYALIVPELLLIVAALWSLFSDRLPGKSRGAAAVAAFLVLCAGLITAFCAKGIALFGSKLILTSDARFGGVVLCLLALVWLVWTAAAGRGRTAEASALVCLSLAGALLATQAGDLIVLLLSLELCSMPVYVLIGYRHSRAKGLEGALKYFLLSVLTSLFMFYGASFVFGLAQTTSFGGLQTLSGEPLAIIAMLFLLIGIFAKMSVAPFHFWAPDAYEGAEPWVVAFAATVPKIAGGFVLVRLIAVLNAQIVILRWPILIASVLCMLLGSLSALTQKDIRRMMAYGGVTVMGYALLLLGITDSQVVAIGWYFAMFFLATYGLPTMGILLISASEGGKISDLAGLSHRRPVAAAALVVFALSLIGIPPLMGFFGKLFIALAGIRGSLIPGVILMVVVSAISAFYYLRLVKAAFFDQPQEAELPATVPETALEAEAETGNEVEVEAATAADDEPTRKVAWGAELAILLCAILTFVAGPAAGYLMTWMRTPPY
ncbi:MAG: NADH-quinone oxidoreductase subunit N [Coriobacteriia bacterium]|nr:NADH-quinone oxidoreductase subunit N [Coriobacteriia bacterium]